MTEQTGWKRLAEAVRGRRHWLGLSQEGLADRGGPSHRVVRQIESGKPPTKPSDATLAKLERGLGWNQGTAQAILNGTAPDDPNRWVGVATPPGFVRMTNPTLPGQSIQVPEAAVTGHERTGWQVAKVGYTPDSEVLPNPWPVVGHDPGTGETLRSAIGPIPGTASAAGRDPAVLFPRDAAIQALLAQVRALETRHANDPTANATRRWILHTVIPGLLERLPSPEWIEWSLSGAAPEPAERDGAD